MAAALTASTPPTATIASLITRDIHTLLVRPSVPPTRRERASWRLGAQRRLPRNASISAASSRGAVAVVAVVLAGGDADESTAGAAAAASRPAATAPIEIAD